MSARNSFASERKPDIYYVEDDGEIAASVKCYLEKKAYRVTVLPTIADAKRALVGRMPALLLVDWNMPDGRGAALCQWVRAKWAELPVIFLTVRGDAGDVVTGFQNGADDYVVKPFDLEVLDSRIRALLRRSGDMTKEYPSCGRIRIDCGRRTVSLLGEEAPAEEIALSPLEYELLLLLMRNKGRTVTRELLLQNLWDDSGNFVNDNTLSVTMKRLREKLRQPECIKTVRSVGYRMEDTV